MVTKPDQGSMTQFVLRLADMVFHGVVSPHNDRVLDHILKRDPSALRGDPLWG